MVKRHETHVSTDQSSEQVPAVVQPAVANSAQTFAQKLNAAAEPPMLESQVTDPMLAWEGNDIDAASLTTELAPRAIEQLGELIEEFGGEQPDYNDDEFRQRAQKLSVLKSELARVRTEFLDNGPGAVVIERIFPEHYVDLSRWEPDRMAVWDDKKGWVDTEEWRAHKQKLKTGLAALSSLLGTELLLQGEQDDSGVDQMVPVKEVKDRGLVYGSANTSHYSDSNRGGNFHTDGAESQRLPWALPLYCVKQAKAGKEGVTVVKSMYPAHNRLLGENPEALKCLYQSFWWDTREDGKPPFQKPIFSYNGQLCFSYLRKYIEAGHDLAEVPLSTADRAALDALDAEISEGSQYMNITLQPGELLITHNFMTIHGRSEKGYEDSKTDPKQARSMLRTWVAEE